MRSIGTALGGRRRHLVTVLAVMAACAAGQGGIANASPTFDIVGYETCTATAAPGPEENFDGAVSACCVQSAGVPTPTNYGMGCVATMDNPPADYRPTIILPTRTLPTDGSDEQGALDALIDLPIPGQG